MGKAHADISTGHKISNPETRNHQGIKELLRLLLFSQQTLINVCVNDHEMLCQGVSCNGGKMRTAWVFFGPSIP